MRKRLVMGAVASAVLTTSAMAVEIETRIDCHRPLQSFDAGARSRAALTVVQALSAAQEAGVDPAQALNLVDWSSE